MLMTLAEHFPEVFNWNFNFIATDLSLEVLEQSRSGRYSQLEVNRGLPAPLLAKYFTRDGERWIFSEQLRKKIMFKELNLVADWPFMPQMDIVFLRNVLIYFDDESRRPVVDGFYRSLHRGGFIFLGHAESVGRITNAFSLNRYGTHLVYRKD